MHLLVPFRSFDRRRGVTIERDTPMLWAIVAILVILWLLGFVAHIAGAFIHLILVVALIVLVVQLVTGRRGSSL